MSRLPGKRARPVLRGLRRGDAPELPDWRIWYYLLEAAGLKVDLVNARDVKNVPGRPKTDLSDSEWIAERSSFVPPPALRELTRYRSALTQERTREVHRLQNVLEDAGIKLDCVVSDSLGKSARAMLTALIAGERDPKVLAELALGRLRAKVGALEQALVGRFCEHHGRLCSKMLAHIDSLTATIESSPARSRSRSSRFSTSGSG